MLHDGDMDGWHYAAGIAPPVNVTFAAVCGAANAGTGSSPVANPTHQAPVTVAAPTGTHVASTSPRPTPTPAPSIEALAPSVAASIGSPVASDTTRHQTARSRSTAPPLLLGGVLLALAGLAALNLAMRRRQ